MDKSKRQKQDEEGAVDEALVVAIERLQEVQDELEKVNEEASDKVLEVEQKYNRVRRPVYVKRTEIIRGMPDFWLTAYLLNLDVEDSPDLKSGYTITFLKKEFKYVDDGSVTISGTPPHWKPGKDLTKEKAEESEEESEEKEGANGDAKKRSRPSNSSFFNWFYESQKRDALDLIVDEVAECIKDDLWPNPLKWFCAEDGDDEDEFDDDGDSEDDEEGDEEEDVSDDEGDDENEDGQ
eukprot:jgi/Mesen1/4203/ME000219S03326